jgi:NAD(P)H-dependent FMN reductase
VNQIIVNAKTRIAVISTSPNDSSNSRILAHAIASIAESQGGVVRVFDIRDLPPVWTKKGGGDNLEGNWLKLKELVEMSQLIILCAPVYFYTIGSPARVIVENLGSSLERKRMLILTAAGSMRSHLAISDFRECLMFEHDVIVFPQTVQITDGDVENGKLSQAVSNRLEAVYSELSNNLQLSG